MNRHEILSALIKQLDAEVRTDSKVEGRSLSCRVDNRLDAVEQFKNRFDEYQATLEGEVIAGRRLDAGESAFIARDLLFVQQKQVNQLYLEMKSTKYIPVNSSMAPGTDTFSTRSYTEVGSAKLVTNYATDWPSADVYVTETLGKVFSFGNSYGWTDQDLRRSALMVGGQPLDQSRASAARLVHAKLIDDIAALGDSASGLNGIASHSNVTILNAVELVGGWATATADEIMSDLNIIENTVFNATGELMPPDTLLLAPAPYARLFEVAANDFTTDTVGTVFLRSRAKYIKNIDSWTKLATAGAAGATRAIAYKRSPDVIDMIVPMAFMMTPPKNFSGKKWDVLCESRFGGTVLYRPNAMVYADTL